MDQEDQSSHKILHSFCVRPNIRFENQEDDEEVLLVLRAHPITLIPWILNGLVLLAILIFLDFALGSFLNAAQFFFINFLAITFILSYFWFNFLGYFFNVGIITNKRIIDLDFHAVIYKEVTETIFSKIEDITAKSGGYFASLFNFGDVFIQTAGTEVNIEFLKVPMPNEVVRIISELVPNT